MNEKLYVCAGCTTPKPRREFHEESAPDRRREVKSRCKECRSQAYYDSRYDTVCAQCLRNRPLDKNKICSRCNEETGLRQCRGPCGALLPIFIEFYEGRRTCKTCSKAARRARSSNLKACE